MKTPLYRQALFHGWQLAWRHKWLWPVGFFAAFLGQMGLLEIMSNVLFATGQSAPLPVWVEIPATLIAGLRNGVGDLTFLNSLSVLWLFVVLFGISALFIFIATASQAALVSAAAESVKTKKYPDVAKAWHIGVGHFWRTLAINIFRKISIFLLTVAVVFGAARLIGEFTGINFFVFIVSFLLSVFVGMVISFIAVYAVGYVVVEEYPLTRALIASWRLFREHMLVSLEVGIVLLFANLLVSVMALFGIFILFLPAMLLWFISFVLGNSILFTIGLFLGLILSFLFIVWVGSVFTVLSTSAWTFLFMRMHSHGVSSRLMQWLTYSRR